MKYSVDPLFVKRTAKFSPCRLYRYTLDIVWDESLPMAAFIGLNPSTADEFQDDPTVRRCRGFAEREGCGGMRMLNIFGYRATDPKVMLAIEDPVGVGNVLHKLIAPIAGPRIACWGSHGMHLGRGAAVAAKIPGLMCFGWNANGMPKHPLYLRADAKLLPMP
ncbi:DUF1643 domain-containing protein [Granulicella cerasi]|uniref:DUF1643 domain-containing protein n=1 Tax=Granulicella cerasi TaxID=741063 RepID=A0ABW1Z5T0_9BACT|nr:DUF1643 domain-containing protein [Granulicella cerasi]